MEFKTLDYGDVVRTGEAVKSSRLRNNMLRDPNSTQNQLLQAQLERSRTTNEINQTKLGNDKQLSQMRLMIGSGIVIMLALTFMRFLEVVVLQFRVTQSILSATRSAVLSHLLVAVELTMGTP